MHQFALRCLVALNGCRVVLCVALVQCQTSPVPSPGHIVVSGLRQSTQCCGGIIVCVLFSPVALSIDRVSGSRQLGQRLCGGGDSPHVDGGERGEDPCWNDGRFSLGSEPIPGCTI